MSLTPASSNAASNDSAADWMRQIRQQTRLCDEALGVKRNLIKRAKADGMNTKPMLAAIKATRLDPDVVAADLRDEMRYMALLRIPMIQVDLFNGWDAELNAQSVHQDDLWDAEDAGYRAGRLGEKVENAPYVEGTEHHAHWMASWQKGQAAIVRELGPDVKLADTSRARPQRTQPNLAGIAPDVPTYTPGATASPRKAVRKPASRKAGASARKSKANGGASAAH